MSDKTIKSLTGLLAGLLCLYGIVLWSTRPQKGKAVYQGSPEEIQKFRIEKPGENPFVIERATGGWVLTDPVHARANQKSVEDFVAGIPNIALEEVISSRSEKHSAFQVTDEEAVHILAYVAGTSDQPVFDLLFGKTAPGGSKYFVRHPGQDEVYIAGGVPTGVINRDLSSWRDKKIFPIHRGELVRVQYRKAGNILLFEEQEGSWKVNGKNGDATKVKEFLQKVVDLSADEFLDEGASEKWESFLEVHTASVTLRVDIGPKPDQSEKVTLQREDGSAYRVSPWRLDFLNKKGIEFLAP